MGCRCFHSLSSPTFRRLPKATADSSAFANACYSVSLSIPPVFPSVFPSVGIPISIQNREQLDFRCLAAFPTHGLITGHYRPALQTNKSHVVYRSTTSTRPLQHDGFFHNNHGESARRPPDPSARTLRRRLRSDVHLRQRRGSSGHRQELQATGTASDQPTNARALHQEVLRSCNIMAHRDMEQSCRPSERRPAQVLASLTAPGCHQRDRQQARPNFSLQPSMLRDPLHWERAAAATLCCKVSSPS